MSESHGTKRARADTAGNAAVPPPVPAVSTKPIPSQGEIAELGWQTTSGLLYTAAKKYPDIKELLTDAVESNRKTRLKRIVDLDCYYSAVWRALQVSYHSTSPSRQSKVALEISYDILGSIEEIQLQCDSFRNSTNRFNGLSVLRKIGKMVFSPTDDTLRHEVQRSIRKSGYVYAMRRIVVEMSNEELRNVLSSKLWKKLQKLNEIFFKGGFFSDFREILALLSGDEEEEEEESEEDLIEQALADMYEESFDYGEL